MRTRSHYLSSDAPAEYSPGYLVMVAKDLCYPDQVIRDLKRTTDPKIASEIMTNARHGLYNRKEYSYYGEKRALYAE